MRSLDFFEKALRGSLDKHWIAKVFVLGAFIRMFLWLFSESNMISIIRSEHRKQTVRAAECGYTTSNCWSVASHTIQTKQCRHPQIRKRIMVHIKPGVGVSRRDSRYRSRGNPKYILQHLFKGIARQLQSEPRRVSEFQLPPSECLLERFWIFDEHASYIGPDHPANTSILCI